LSIALAWQAIQHEPPDVESVGRRRFPRASQLAASSDSRAKSPRPALRSR
jgi:hypothetical protein